ncbi:RICIN domain-containing protein [Actinosynnema sp. NPDC023794]
MTTAFAALVASATTATAATDPYEYLIVPVHSEKCLDVLDADPGDAADIVQWTCDGRVSQRFSAAPADGGPAQRWRVEGGAAHGYGIVSDDTGLCLEVEFASLEDGAEVRQYPCHGQANQRFSFDDVPA